MWLALPASGQLTPDGPVTIWNVRADGSAARPLAEFSGFVASFAFSPDLARVAYWRPVAPQSNTRELHIANVDGSESILYDTAHLIEFLGWSPDSQHFVYTLGGGQAGIKSVKQGPDYVSPIDESTVYRAPTQRVTLEVVKVYKGDDVPGQTLTLHQEGVGVTRSIQFPWPVFRINENDPVYERGERYVLMLWPVPIGEEIKPYQPEPWQEGMFSVVHPGGRMRLNADGTVTSVLDSFGTNGKTLEQIEARIAAATAAPSYPTAYNGLPLPTPRPGGGPRVPAAWLVVGNIAVPGSGGSYAVTMIDKGECCLTEHGDAPPPPLYPDLATATLAADEQAVIVIGTGSIKEFHATVRPWTDEPALYSGAERELKAEAEPAGNATVFVLEPTGEAGDWLLLVSITFPVEFDPTYPDNSASYLWRLNPALATTVPSSQSDLAQAREALVDYFSLLHARRYAEAANYYGGSYDTLRDWNPTVDPNDYAALFENGCTINGLMCLEVRTIVQEEAVSSNGFKFVVEFTNDDGSIFVRGPCCGATETDMPPQSQFPYTVRKVEGRFLVQELPVSVP